MRIKLHHLGSNGIAWWLCICIAAIIETMHNINHAIAAIQIEGQVRKIIHHSAKGCTYSKLEVDKITMTPEKRKGYVVAV